MVGKNPAEYAPIRKGKEPKITRSNSISSDRPRNRAHFQHARAIDPVIPRPSASLYKYTEKLAACTGAFRPSWLQILKAGTQTHGNKVQSLMHKVQKQGQKKEAMWLIGMFPEWMK